MADDELKLRITPEVDEDALKRAQAEIDAISGKVNLGGKGKGGGVDGALKAELASIRANIDANDLKLRKFVANSLEEENLIRKKQALNQLTAQQANTLLAQESNARENMVAETVAGYQLVEKQLASLDQANQQVINRQKQLFYASERAQSGFSSMSRSMGALTSGTKDANIAFANFGRIIQDAPFGILGISNNIDPLLVSFASLKASAGSTTLALRSMINVMMGPLGLIFLLGSVLPSAAVIYERAMQGKRRATREAKEEMEGLNSAIERFAKLAADAAAGQGVGQVEVELGLARDELGRLTKEYEELAEYRRGGYVDAEREAILTSIDGERKIMQAVIDRLDAQRTDAKIEQSIQDLRKRGAVAESLRIDEAIKDNKELSEARAREQEERNKILLQQFAELELQRSFNEAIREARDAYLQQALAVTIASRAEEEAFRKKVEREAGRGRDSTLTDDADFDRAVKAEERLGQMRIDMLRMSGDEEAAIVEEGERRKRDAKMELLKLGITDKKAIDQELAMIDAETQNAIKANDKTVAQARADEMLVYADAVSAGLGAIFGENKAVQSAQVVIDTIAGANKAFAGLMPNFPLAVAAAASVTAQGISALRKINSSTKKSKSLGGSGSASASVASATQKPFVTDAISPSGANIAGRIGAMNNQPQFNVTATVDRMGLALAVRDGESDISTRQIPFAS
jgi:hypothetical protein